MPCYLHALFGLECDATTRTLKVRRKRMVRQGVPGIEAAFRRLMYRKCVPELRKEVAEAWTRLQAAQKRLAEAEVREELEYAAWRTDGTVPSWLAPPVMGEGDADDPMDGAARGHAASSAAPGVHPAVTTASAVAPARVESPADGGVAEPAAVVEEVQHTHDADAPAAQGLAAPGAAQTHDPVDDPVVERADAGGTADPVSDPVAERTDADDTDDSVAERTDADDTDDSIVGGLADAADHTDDRDARAGHTGDLAHEDPVEHTDDLDAPAAHTSDLAHEDPAEHEAAKGTDVPAVAEDSPADEATPPPEDACAQETLRDAVKVATPVDESTAAAAHGSHEAGLAASTPTAQECAGAPADAAKPANLKRKRPIPEPNRVQLRSCGRADGDYHSRPAKKKAAAQCPDAPEPGVLVPPPVTKHSMEVNVEEFEVYMRTYLYPRISNKGPEPKNLGRKRYETYSFIWKNLARAAANYDRMYSLLAMLKSTQWENVAVLKINNKTNHCTLACKAVADNFAEIYKHFTNHEFVA